MWELEAQSFRVLEGRRSGVSTVASSRDDSTLVSRDYVGKIVFWDGKGDRCIRKLLDESIEITPMLPSINSLIHLPSLT